MIAKPDQPAQQTGSEARRCEPLPEWFDDQKVQERVARLIAKAAMERRSPGGARSA
jgi:hypothetical protein